ncbi:MULTISPECIES: YheC/YheD family protein [Neobacillus]|uniref:YheC/YheD family protein n=1 Tax=Neobacillus sedimentimangrovi TaxID=2699460 RepID=A0ABS8QF31_9BACI|nr:YheC/YheD family protein [Neobacillus sedimentimangrovi]MCD4837838.1 YheC/YheD family protein [Neobacillus sedimentimangrovi]
MLALGIMSLHLDSEATYITEMAKHSHSCGVECFRFVPSQINPHTLQVSGLRFDSETGNWKKDTFTIPSILYDRCFYGEDEHSKKCLPIVSWLKNRKDIHFLGYGLPNKFDLYESLKTTELSPYLPNSQLIEKADLVMKELHEGKKIILKPVNGSQGFGIYYVKKSNKSFHVKTEKQRKIISRIFPTESKLLQWLQPLIKKYDYLLQPYLELSNEDHQPFDIRILLQKNEHGIWKELGRGIRIGNTGGILSNLSAGGTIETFSNWITSIPKNKADYIRSELDYIISALPRLLEDQFPPLFEIGVDIGIAKNGSIWILDINSKPGRKLLLNTFPEIKEQLFKAPLLYAKHLSETDHQERKDFYAKTLSH